MKGSGHKFKSGKRGRPAFDAVCVTCGVSWSKHDTAVSTEAAPAAQSSNEDESLDLDDDDTTVHRSVTPLTPDEQLAIDEYLERLHPGFTKRRINALQRV